MKRFRPVLNAILGLLLLVQGIAVAHANGGLAVRDEAPMSAHMPCHGDEDGTNQATAPCCGHECPDMTVCALGHLAVASAPVIAFTPTAAPRLTPRMPSPPIVVPPALLRPPIDRHD